MRKKVRKQRENNGKWGKRGWVSIVTEQLVTHYALTKSHTLQLETIQKQAIQIVLNFSRGMPYSSMLFAADFNSLASRREDISRKFFHNITQSTSCLHHLLPDPKLSSHNSRLRSYEKFPRLHTAPNDTVHLSSTHWATIRIEYITHRLFTFDSDLLHYSLYFLLHCIIHCIFTFICIFISIDFSAYLGL